MLLFEREREGISLWLIPDWRGGPSCRFPSSKNRGDQRRNDPELKMQRLRFCHSVDSCIGTDTARIERYTCREYYKSAHVN